MPARTQHNHEARMTRIVSWSTRALAFTLAGLGLAACVEDAVLAPPPPNPAEVVHYWHFNALPAGTLTAVAADASTLAGAEITYPGTGAGYMDQVSPGTDLNAEVGTVAGLGLRPRNPANTRELIIVAPSTGYEDLELSWAVQRSSAGAAQEEVSFSVDGGTTWVPVGGVIAVSEAWEVQTIDLAAFATTDDRPGLRFRILFTGLGADGASGNHRLDNLKITGVPRS